MAKQKKVAINKSVESSQEKPAAIVTGGAQGIGYGICKSLLTNGFRVLIADINQAKMQETLEELSVIGEVHGVKTDVSSEEDVQRMIKVAQKTFGNINLLVNNAALADPESGKMHELTIAKWNKALAVNLTGTFLCSKHAIPHLLKTNGNIVNVSSTRSLMSEPNTEAYAACKGGVDALTHAMAMSYGPHIRVNNIRPGWINTKEGKSKLDNPKDNGNTQHPVGRVGSPQDIGELVVFLASEKSGFITGQSFTCDGGVTKKMIYT